MIEYMVILAIVVPISILALIEMSREKSHK